MNGMEGKYLKMLSPRQIAELHKLMRVYEHEDQRNYSYTLKNGTLTFRHTYNGVFKSMSDYTDFFIAQIYGVFPSEYDQKKFRNFMCEELAHTDYEKQLNNWSGAGNE